MNDWHEIDGERGLHLEIILDHYRDPHNKGPLADATFRYREARLSCGDDLEVAVRLGADGRVEEAKFDGSGCSMSVAAASMLTDFVKGKTVAELQALGEADVSRMLGFEVNASRLGCATLALKVLQRGLAEYLGKP
jgi:nitrogen fixation NifU-like protein